MTEYNRNSKKSGSSRKSDNSAPGSSKRKFKLIALLCAVVLILGFLSWCIIKLPAYFYTKNPRLEFKNLEVDSTGYWQKNPELLLERLELKKGANLFALNLQLLREKLEKIPSIETAEVRLHLPDTLKIKIIERIPRASLFSVNSPAVIDASGVIMKRKESSAGNQRLPVIKGLRNENIATQVKPALHLILNALSNYPDIAIQEISLAVPGELRVKLYYRNRKQCMLLLPSNDDDYNYLLSVFQTTILRSGSNWSIYDLRYKGSVSGR